jgi:alkylated DNA repair dioxygenase AlkB
MIPQRISLEDGGELLLVEGWLSPPERASFFDALMREVPWQQKAISMMGRQVMQPRLVAWFGDPGAEYTYSGVRNDPLPWTPALAELRRRAEETAGEPFNSVLANLYRDGRDSMGFHADKEKELGPDPVIASISLGATRRFQLRYVGKKKGVPGRDIDLTDGSLLVMRGTTQHFWRHGIPKETRPVGARINLTFRRIVGSTGQPSAAHREKA